MAVQLYRPNDSLAETSTFDLMPKALELASKLSGTEFVPLALRNKPAAIMACMLQGHEVGLPPMASLQLIDVIEGRPSLRAAGQRALILAKGHEIWIEEASATRATVCGRRRGEERVTSITWTMDEAKRAGLVNKQNWQRYPRNMLVARATGDVARGTFMDVLAGLAYNSEELEDLGDGAPSPEAPLDIAPAPPARQRRARRPATAAPAVTEPPPEPPAPPEPDSDEGSDGPAQEASEPPPPPEPEPLAGEAAGGEALTLAQQIAMACSEAGVNRQTVIEAVTGKTRGRDLTREEAIQVLDAARAIGRGEGELSLIADTWVFSQLPANEA